MHQSTDEFIALLAPSFFDSLERAPSSAFGCWPDGRIAYLNPAYARFAEDNGGGPDFLARWGLGCSALDVVVPPLDTFFRERFSQALAGRVTSFTYEC